LVGRGPLYEIANLGRISLIDPEKAIKLCPPLLKLWLFEFWISFPNFFEEKSTQRVGVSRDLRRSRSFLFRLRGFFIYWFIFFFSVKRRMFFLNVFVFGVPSFGIPKTGMSENIFEFWRF